MGDGQYQQSGAVTERLTADDIMTRAPQSEGTGGRIRRQNFDRPSDKRPRWGRRSLLLVAAVVVVAGALLVALDPFAGSGSPSSGQVATSVTTVVQRNLSSTTEQNATLGYAGSYNVVNQSQGTITHLPAIGSVISQGQVLYTVGGSPVVLLYGSTPAFRSLSAGASASDVTGPDVQELNADLVALGFATTSALDPNSNEFSSETTAALERLQVSLGVADNGTLALGQAVFLPTAARITAETATLGAQAPPGQSIMTATSTTRQVTVQLDASLQGDVKVGDPVTITLPDNSTTPGVVSAVGTVATTPSDGGTGSSPPTIDVAITPSNPAATGNFDQAPVDVAIVNNTVANALVVPVASLLALANGGYAVEVVPRHGPHHLVGVTTGLFDNANGYVQVTGAGLVAGMQIVQPSS